MDHEDLRNGKNNFSQYLQFKRSTKSHPRAESVSSGFSSNLSRSKSSGRDARMTDIFNAYKTQQAQTQNANSFSDARSVQSLGSNNSLMSNWSYVSAPRSLVPSEVHDSSQRLTPAPSDDCLSTNSDRSRSSSISSNLTLWRPLTNEIAGCKRKFSSIAEAISDSEEEEQDYADGGLAKRPRTPVPNLLSDSDTNQIFSKLRAVILYFFRSLLRILLLAIILISCIFFFTFYKSYQCNNYRSQNINTSAVMETLSGNIFGQVLATKAIVETLSSYSALKPSFDTVNEKNDTQRSGTTLLMVFNGWVGVGKTHTATLLTHILPVEHNTLFLSCSLISSDMVPSIGDRICHRCGYGLLVLDDCDMGDNVTSEIVTSIVSDINGRYQTATSGIIIVLTTSEGGRSISHVVRDELEENETLTGVTSKQIEEKLVEDQSKLIQFQNSVGALPKLIFKIVPFLPLALESVSKCAKKLAKDQGLQLSSSQMNDLVKLLQLSTLSGVTIVHTGCKQISSRVDMILGHQRLEL